MNKFLWCAVLAAALVPAISQADDSTPLGTSSAPVAPVTPPQPPSPWKGDVALGYLKTTGNTTSTSLNFKGNLNWKVSPWENNLHAQAIEARSGGNSTAESYQAGDQLTFDFTDTDYIFGNINYISDRFAGVVERYSESVGYGRHVLNTPTQKLDLAVGIGSNQQRVAPDPNIPGDNPGLTTEFIGVFDGNYKWKISDNARFRQTLHIEAGQTNTFINPVTDLKLTIVGNLYASLDYEVRYNTTVPASTVHTDTIASVNVGYSFGEK